MKKEILQTYIEQGLSSRAIAQRENKSQTTINYWLKKYALKTSILKAKIHICSNCGDKNPKNFYGHKKSLCKKCYNLYRVSCYNKTRKRIIDHMGGKCRICGFNKFAASMDIHHLDSSKKDKQFKNLKKWAWERIEKELDNNCILLCKNCHAAIHSGELTGAMA